MREEFTHKKLFYLCKTLNMGRNVIKNKMFHLRQLPEINIKFTVELCRQQMANLSRGSYEVGGTQ